MGYTKILQPFVFCMQVSLDRYRTRYSACCNLFQWYLLLDVHIHHFSVEFRILHVIFSAFFVKTLVFYIYLYNRLVVVIIVHFRHIQRFFTINSLLFSIFFLIFNHIQQFSVVFRTLRHNHRISLLERSVYHTMQRRFQIYSKDFTSQNYSNPFTIFHAFSAILYVVTPYSALFIYHFNVHKWHYSMFSNLPNIIDCFSVICSEIFLVIDPSADIFSSFSYIFRRFRCYLPVIIYFQRAF